MEGSRHSPRLKAQAKKGAKKGKKQPSLASQRKGKLQTNRKQRSLSPIDLPAEKKMKSVSVVFRSPRMGFQFWGKYDSV